MAQAWRRHKRGARGGVEIIEEGGGSKKARLTYEIMAEKAIDVDKYCDCRQKTQLGRLGVGKDRRPTREQWQIHQNRQEMQNQHTRGFRNW